MRDMTLNVCVYIYIYRNMYVYTYIYICMYTRISNRRTTQLNNTLLDFLIYCMCNVLLYLMYPVTHNICVVLLYCMCHPSLLICVPWLTDRYLWLDASSSFTLCVTSYFTVRDDTVCDTQMCVVTFYRTWHPPLLICVPWLTIFVTSSFTVCVPWLTIFVSSSFTARDILLYLYAYRDSR